MSELVARGLSDKQVAAELFLSAKTVQYHLARSYAKLGLRSRTELAARRTEAGPPSHCVTRTRVLPSRSVPVGRGKRPAGATTTRSTGRWMSLGLDSPYTRWTGDGLHGRTPVLYAVWVRLDALYIRVPGSPSHTIITGLDFTGEVPGRLHGWFPTLKGDWLGVVNFEIPYADQRREPLSVRDQLVPAYALRPKGDGEHGEP